MSWFDRGLRISADYIPIDPPETLFLNKKCALTVLNFLIVRYKLGVVRQDRSFDNGEGNSDHQVSVFDVVGLCGIVTCWGASVSS